jgi:hypothetical protein
MGILMSDTPVISSLAHTYKVTFARLEEFRNEEHDWDGCGGRPASDATCQDVTSFLNAAIALELIRPSLVLSSSGAVSAVWQDSNVYITANFCGTGDYCCIVISRSGAVLHTGIESKPGIIGTPMISSVQQVEASRQKIAESIAK